MTLNPVPFVTRSGLRIGCDYRSPQADALPLPDKDGYLLQSALLARRPVTAWQRGKRVLRAVVARL